MACSTAKTTAFTLNCNTCAHVLPVQASLVKAWTTQRGREVASLGREVLGGNGILTDFNVAKVHTDVLCCDALSRFLAF